MRLIDTETLELLEFWGDKIPEYAILSHTWEEGEVTFQDWHHPEITHRMEKKGYYKISMACKKARRGGYKYLWCDTNCIDKTSSAELSEAINSMFSWYQNSSVCYVYLSDVEPRLEESRELMTDEYIEQFCRSKWFTRGWTLQELLAPKEMIFYSRDWSRIATRTRMEDDISAITHISKRYLRGDGKYNDASVAQKMSWISRRRTTRIEDMAYCMLGIFGINMPLLYGEGSKSFTRLQEEIIRTSNDQTIFCWTWTDAVSQDWVSLLAPCPQVFEFSTKYFGVKDVIKDIKRTYKMTNAGLSINLPVVQAWSYYLGILNAQDEVRESAGGHDYLVCLPLHGSLAQRREMRRLRFPPGPFLIPVSWALCQSHMYISSNPTIHPYDDEKLISWPTLFEDERYPFLLLFGNTEKLPDAESRVRDDSHSIISTGKRVCFLEARRPMLKVSPPVIFDERKSLVTLHRNSLPQGFLITIGTEHPRRVLFIGIGTRSQESDPRPHKLYRLCKIVPESDVREASTSQELLAKQIDSMKEKGEGCEKSSRHGIRIVMREEAVTEKDHICLIYIYCKKAHDKVNSHGGSNTRSDVGLESGRQHERAKTLIRLTGGA